MPATMMSLPMWGNSTGPVQDGAGDRLYAYHERTCVWGLREPHSPYMNGRKRVIWGANEQNEKFLGEIGMSYT